MHISVSVDPSTAIWVSLERSSPLQNLSISDANILAKGDDVRSGTKANASHGHRRQWIKSSTPLEYVRENFKYLTRILRDYFRVFNRGDGSTKLYTHFRKTHLWTCRYKETKPSFNHFEIILLNKFQTEKYISFKSNNIKLF